MEELNNSLKAFRNDLLGLHTLQQDLREFRLRLIKVERDLCVSRTTNNKLKDELITEKAERKQDFKELSESVSKLTEVNNKLQEKCEGLEKQIANKKEKSTLNSQVQTVIVTVVPDLITDFPGPESQAVLLQEPGNIQDEIDIGSEGNATQWINQFVGDPQPLTAVVVSPDQDSLLEAALKSADLFQFTSSLPLFNEADVQHTLMGDTSAAEDSDSGIENKPPSPAVSKNNAALWKLPHGKDPLDPSGLTCLCGIKKENKKAMLEHIHYYTKEWKFRCEFCNKPFARNNILLKHQLKKHKDQISVGSAMKKVGCRKCGMKFPSRGEHKRHLKSCGSGTESSNVRVSSSSNQMDLEISIDQHSNEASSGSQIQYASSLAPISPGGSSIDSSLVLEEDFSMDAFIQSADIDNAVQEQILDLLTGKK